MSNNLKKYRGFASTTRLSDALKLILDNMEYKKEVETIKSTDSLNRVLAEDIIAKFNIPGFRRSAMDGYAVISKDTYGASDSNPKVLKLIGSIEIGDTETIPINQGCCIRISTGAPIPDDADAVVKYEDTEDFGDGTIAIYLPVSKGKNISNEDEDVTIGETVFNKNRLISEWDIAMLLSLGYDKIKVFSRPKIAIISTGNELVQQGSPLLPGQVYDSNRPAIATYLDKTLNVNVVANFSCADDPDVIKNHLLEIAPYVDLIITTGGTSVGGRDYMQEIMIDIGNIWVHGLSIRPGKPVIIGQIKQSKTQCNIIALPGYPLAAFINFEKLVIPLINKWVGYKPIFEYERIELLQAIPSKLGVRDFVRLKKVGFNSELNIPQAKLIRITGAGILSSLVNADYLLEIEEDREGYSINEIVTVRKL